MRWIAARIMMVAEDLEARTHHEDTPPEAQRVLAAVEHIQLCCADIIHTLAG